LNYLVSDFRTAGYSDSTIQSVLEHQYTMLDKLGVKYEIFAVDTCEYNSEPIKVFTVKNAAQNNTQQIDITDNLIIVDDDTDKNFGGLAFVLALLVLALIACVVVLIIIGRRIKFLQGASLDASNVSNLTARNAGKM